MSSRAPSPAPLVRAFRFSTQPDDQPRRQADRPSRERTSTFSPSSSSPRDPFTAHPAASASFVTFDPPSTSTPSASPTHHGTLSALASLPKRARGSILLATSSLSLPRQLGRPRKKPPPPAPANQLLFTEVIEISAPPKEIDEEEERNRLRDAAAQSLGIDTGLMDEPARRTHDSYNDLDEAHEDHSDAALADSLVFDARRPSVTSTSIASSSTTTPVPDPESILPPFPALLAALEPFTQFSARIPKHHPPPTILALALSRQWKHRHLVLTVSPSSPSSASTPVSPLFPGASQGASPSAPTSPVAAHLHIFKSAASDARELERLPISADSGAFLSETPVAGRAALRVRGADGREWALAATPTEAQTWIEHIKGVVLSQRSVRAGLGAVTPSARGNEPRGDLDVVLSLRAQTLFSTPTSPTSSRPSTAAQSPAPNGHRTPAAASSTPSLRSVATATNTVHGTSGHSPGNGSASGSVASHGTRPQSPAVAALRGLFSGRPRSPSTATISSTHLSGGGASTTHGTCTSTDEGASIMGVLDSVSPPSPVPASLLVERKILEERERERVMQGLNDDNAPTIRSSIGLGLGIGPGMSRRSNAIEALQPLQLIPRVDSPSLQPPPRRRAWTSSGVPLGPRAMHARSNGSAHAPGSMHYTHANASTAESFGLRPILGSPLLSSEREPQRPRTSTSTSSVSATSAGSGDRRTSLEWSPKRWSRQGKLPTQLTPPSGPPPAVPSAPSPASSSFRASLSVPRHPYAEAASICTQPSSSTLTPSSNANTSGVSRSSSVQSNTSPQQGLIGSLQNFSKRASNASVQSISTLSSNTTHSHAHSAVGGNGKVGQRPRSSHRSSIPPPPRPAPSTALPPTPTPSSPTTSAPPDEPTTPGTGASPSQKMSFRESLALRSKRFSLSPPTLPPSSDLPPRPDETSTPSTTSPARASWERHRRCASNGSARPLYPIPASPSPPSLAPPPSGPLPPTPASEKDISMPAPRPSPAFKLGRRLRMLSAPAPSPPPHSAPPAQPPSPTPSTINPYSLPPTPIGEPILAQNDPQLLLTTSPPTPPPRSQEQPPPPEASPELRGITSLSPPPRKGSRRGVAQSSEDEERRPATADASTQSHHQLTPLSLSPQPSAVSLVDVRF